MTKRTVISNALIIDGDGGEPYAGSLAFADGMITAVGDVAATESDEVVDAGGHALSPGFIDLHTHSDLQILANPDHEARITQGITTELLGQDGLSYAPVDDVTLPRLRERIRGWNDDPDGFDWNWRSVDEYLARLEEGIACNAAYLIPHGNLRELVMGSAERSATDAEVAAMGELLRLGMAAGAYGMSDGLTYVPAMFASTDELIMLCKVVAEYDGLYVPHHRNYGSDALGGYGECFDIARASGVRLHLAHAHLSYPPNEHRLPELITLFDTAEADGVDFSFDAYPYEAAMSTLHAQFPGWTQTGTLAEQRARFTDPDSLRRITEAMEVTGSDGHSGLPVDWSIIVIGGVPTPTWERVVGRNVAEVAVERGTTGTQTAIDILLGTDFGASCLMFFGFEPNIRTLMTHPRHTVGSDGILVGSKPHPRSWGTFPRVLGHYVRDEGVLSLAEAVRHMTSAPADRLQLTDRGRLRVGHRADLVIFDADTVGSPATYADPRQAAVGIDRVIINGETAVLDGLVTGSRSGQVLRHRP
ncbi:N-acyl-D-amino-acid deacylase family protein [Propionibacteriaceae bacterium Y1685]